MKRVEYVAKWLVCAVALALAGCASPYTTAAASLTAAERVVAEASRQWPAYSDAKRAAIVEQAASYDAGAAALTEWNAKADKVSAAIAGAHATVKLGADGLQGVRAVSYTHLTLPTNREV